jgi:hypothetical protein
MSNFLGVFVAGNGRWYNHPVSTEGEKPTVEEIADTLGQVAHRFDLHDVTLVNLIPCA